jgi:hypothetical protein
LMHTFFVNYLVQLLTGQSPPTYRRYICAWTRLNIKWSIDLPRRWKSRSYNCLFDMRVMAQLLAIFRRPAILRDTRTSC